MLIPRFSLLWLLALVTVSAGVSFVLAYAYRGHEWALGATAGMGGVVLLFLLYILTFLAAWVVSQVEAAVFKGSSAGEGGSPFAGSPPPSPLGAPEPGLPATSDAPPPMTG